MNHKVQTRYRDLTKAEKVFFVDGRYGLLLLTHRLPTHPRRFTDYWGLEVPFPSGVQATGSVHLEIWNLDATKKGHVVVGGSEGSWIPDLPIGGFGIGVPWPY